MKLEDQVVSLNLAKRLKELNLKQNSLFYYVRQSINTNNGEETYRLELLQHNLTTVPEYYISAFSVAELGEMLPRTFVMFYREKGDTDFADLLKMHLGRHEKSWSVSYYQKSSEKIFFEDENEANARAKMIIFLIENNLVTEEWRKQWMI